MEDEKDSIIVEFITKFQGLAYQKRICFLCGGGRIWNIKNPSLWKPRHNPDCLFSRAEKLVVKEQLPVSSEKEVVMNQLIEGVQLKALITHADERGFFREVLRVTDEIFTEGFGQWSHSLGHTGVIKAWHIHQKQTDLFYLPFGVAKVVLHDCREDSPTHRFTNEFMMGDGYDPMVLKIPPGIAHGLKVIQGPAHLFYITSRVYDPKDEGRIPHDDPAIGHDWLKGPEIK